MYIHRAFFVFTVFEVYFLKYILKVSACLFDRDRGECWSSSGPDSNTCYSSTCAPEAVAIMPLEFLFDNAILCFWYKILVVNAEHWCQFCLFLIFRLQSDFPNWWSFLRRRRRCQTDFWMFLFFLIRWRFHVLGSLYSQTFQGQDLNVPFDEWVEADLNVMPVINGLRTYEHSQLELQLKCFCAVVSKDLNIHDVKSTQASIYNVLSPHSQNEYNLYKLFWYVCWFSRFQCTGFIFLPFLCLI